MANKETYKCQNMLKVMDSKLTMADIYFSRCVNDQRFLEQHDEQFADGSPQLTVVLKKSKNICT